MDLITFCLLNLEEVDNGIDSKIDRNICVGKGGGKQEIVIIVCASYILCLNYFCINNDAVYY